jgi:hypothetical protein
MGLHILDKSFVQRRGEKQRVDTCVYESFFFWMTCYVPDQVLGNDSGCAHTSTDQTSACDEDSPIGQPHEDKKKELVWTLFLS